MNPELTRATFSYSAEPNLRSVLRKDSKIPLNNCGGESSLYSTQGLVTDEKSLHVVGDRTHAEMRRHE